MMCGHFSGLISILNVCTIARLSPSISLRLRFSSLENFLNLGRFLNSSVSCFFFKGGNNDFTYVSAFIFWFLDCLSSVYALYVASHFPLLEKDRLLDLKILFLNPDSLLKRQFILVFFHGWYFSFLHCFLVWCWLVDSVWTAGLPRKCDFSNIIFKRPKNYC